MVSAKASLPRLGLGMAALGRPGYINLNRSSILGSDDRDVKTMQHQANTVMDRLFSLSVDNVAWLDCARSYGLSEKFVGEYLKSNNIKPDEVYVSSKWGYTYVADWKVSLEEGKPHEVKDHSAQKFLKQVEETVEFLGDYVNLYQVHSATFESGILSDPKAHAALRKCRKERGWALGLSVSGPNQNDVLRQAMTLVENGEPLFDSVQCTYNVLEQRPAEALLEAHNSGMDIIIKEGLANGRALKNEAIIKYSKQLGCEPDSLALACILAQPFEPRVLSGAITPDQLESNFKAIEVSEKLKEEPELLTEIMSACVVNSEQYWADRSALAWN
jgi:aryl-alcohol dehydrogenase-like predicted oxidoreductase